MLLQAAAAAIQACCVVSSNRAGLRCHCNVCGGSYWQQLQKAQQQWYGWGSINCLDLRDTKTTSVLRSMDRVHTVGLKL